MPTLIIYFDVINSRWAHVAVHAVAPHMHMCTCTHAFFNLNHDLSRLLVYTHFYNI